MVTTSWDDGDPLDWKIAELLHKYNVEGTFYIPNYPRSGGQVLLDSEVRELSSSFEIGAHTVQHIPLTRLSDESSEEEIRNSKTRIEDITGQSCAMFCPPKGHYYRRHVRLVCEAGYTGMRTTGLLSTNYPKNRNGLSLMSTSIQAIPHTSFIYMKNLTKRRAFENLKHARSITNGQNWKNIARELLDYVLKYGGVFHLWGHSWEVEELGLWAELEDVLRLLSDFKEAISFKTNGEICRNEMSTNLLYKK